MLRISLFVSLSLGFHGRETIPIVNSDTFYLLGACKFEDCSLLAKSYPITSSSLIVDDVIATEDCIAHGETFDVFVKFKTITKEHFWTMEIDGSRKSNLTGVINDGNKNATLIIGPDQYGPPGNVELKVTVSPNDVIKTYISKIICTRLLSYDMSVTVKKTWIQGDKVLFNITKTSKLPLGNFSIDFGDGSTKILPRYSFNDHILKKIYSDAGKYTFKWRCYDNYKISRGTGEINITAYHPVKPSERYLFPVEINLLLPKRTASFFISSSCPFKPPTDAMYRIDYGDGSNYTSWTRVPHYECGKSSKLPTHTYDKSGCYNVKFQIKNRLGLRNDTSNVSIDQVSNKILLRFNTVPPLLESNKKVDDDGNVYLSDEFPFQIEAIVNASTCYRFEWTIQNPYWHISTSNISKVKIYHLVNKTGVYNLTVKVSGKTRTMSKTKQLIILKALRNLVILSTTPSDDKQVYVYLLLKEPGPSPMLTWDFGDGKIIKERGINFITANNLPKIRNAPGSRKLDLAIYKGLYKKHKFRYNGLFHVSVKASDAFRELTARRTVFVSNSPCRRPKVNILIPNGSSKFTISIGETFTVQTHVEMRCDFSDQAIFRWEVYSSNKKDMESARIAESDRKIK